MIIFSTDFPVALPAHRRAAAEEYAGRIAKEARKYGLHAMVADLQDYDMVCSQSRTPRLTRRRRVWRD